MENMSVQSDKPERGCLLTGVLWLSFIGALFNSFFSIAFLIANFPKRLAEVEYWVFLLAAVISVYGLYAVYQTLKMKKKYARHLLWVMLLTSVLLIVGAFIPMPVTPEQKSGAMWMLIFALVCWLCAIVVASHLKKMK